MRHSILFSFAYVLLGSFSGSLLLAVSMDEALVNRTLNEVFIHENATAEGAFRNAKAKEDRISGEEVLRTGARSRAELLFGDQSIARLGSNTVFSFIPEQREMLLGRGLLLYQAPKKLGVTRISTATATASITGTTILMEVGENVTKIILLEGAMRVSIPTRVGEYVDLEPGQMLLFPNDATRLPPPVNVDIAALVASSDILGMFIADDEPEIAEEGNSAISLILIDEAAQAQRFLMEEGKMSLTDLAILGRGSQLQYLIDLENEWLLSALDQERPGVDMEDPGRPLGVNRDMREEGTESGNTPPVPVPAPPHGGGPDNGDSDDGGRDPDLVMHPPLITSPDPFLLGWDVTINTNPSIVIEDQSYPGAKYLPEVGTMSEFLSIESLTGGDDYGVDQWANEGASSWFHFKNLDIEVDPEVIHVLSGIERIGFISDGDLNLYEGYYTFSPLSGLTLVAHGEVHYGPQAFFENPGLDLRLMGKSVSFGYGSSANTKNLELIAVESLFIDNEATLTSQENLILRGKNIVIGEEGSYSNYGINLSAPNIRLEGDRILLADNVKFQTANSDFSYGMGSDGFDGQYSVDEGGGLNQEFDEIGEGTPIQNVVIRAEGSHVSSGFAIEVSSSAEILALAENSKILLEAIQGNIAMNGTLQADIVEVIARGDQARIELLNTAMILADVIKIGALGANGELLVGSNQGMVYMRGESLIRLYANLESGTVRFAGDTHLQSADIQIGGDRVMVDEGVNVFIENSQPGKVYANQHLYGINGYGSFGGSGVTQHNVSEAPSF